MPEVALAGLLSIQVPSYRFTSLQSHSADPAPAGILKF